MSSQHSGFKTGNICRIYIKDFLTFDEIEVRPKPHLNFIMGPNGAGKSTILCAICICLGGKPAVTGRGKEVTDYIKYGKDTSVLETEIFVEGNSPNVIITRQFDRDKKTTWFLHNKEVSKKVIETKIASLNIQVDNLCQFLPQDRVASFAKMNCIQLLEATEKAVGDARLFEQHDLLRSSGDKMKDLRAKVKDLEAQLDIAVKKNDRLKDAVKNHELKNRLEMQIEKLQTQKLWYLFALKRDKHVCLKKRYTEQKNAYLKKKSELEPACEKIEKAKKDMVEYKKDINNRTRFAEMKQKEVDKLHTQYQQHEEALQDAQREYSGREQEEQQRMRELSDYRKHLDVLLVQLNNLPQVNDEQTKKRLTELTLDIQEASQSMVRLESQKEEAIHTIKESERRISSMDSDRARLQDVKRQRLELLNKINGDAYRAAKWLESNTNKFSAPVYAPLCTELNIKDPKYAKYVEDRVSYQDLVAFVCENKEDMNLFKELMDKQKLRVNVVHSSPVDMAQFQPKIPIENIKEFGFLNYMIDVIDAPPAILSYLCRTYSIFRIPIAEKADFDRVPVQLTYFYIGGERYSKAQSRYDREWSTSIYPVKDARLLHITLDTQRILQLQKDIQERHDMIADAKEKLKQNKTEELELTKNLEILRNEKRVLHCRKEERKQMEQRIANKKNQIARHEKSSINLEGEKAKMTQKIKETISTMIGIMTDQKKTMEVLAEVAVEHFRLVTQAAVTRTSLQTLEEDVVSYKQEIKNLQGTIDKLYDEQTAAKADANSTFEELLTALGIKSHKDVTNEIRERYKNSNLEETEQKLHQLEAHRDCLITANDSEVREYRQREQEVINLKQRLEESQNKAGNHHKALEDSRESWLGKIGELTENISNNFSSFMARLGCAGEVLLDVGDKDDFRTYGIKIKVRFRDSDRLRELTAQHQSGGERAVSTALYLLALQSLTSVPFRCVDEINQGMDPINERRMLNMLVKTVAAEESSQYFFVTPKLIPDMEYNKYVNVMVVFNSRTMLPHRKFHLRKILKRRQELNGKENIASA
ncbi:structural maintenance of chromosomes protein 5-like [Penaeus chinensis]|uniref:structural maintenance of chromosomes protein 5-like n=1 Tax=Penaeus chinensis TaxID=139456 RepID=UPI001FB6CE2D|nr:structural maintenance of chromosomes protein 5-like [Penaeus chinensis]